MLALRLCSGRLRCGVKIRTLLRWALLRLGSVREVPTALQQLLYLLVSLHDHQLHRIRLLLPVLLTPLLGATRVVLPLHFIIHGRVIRVLL